MGYSPEYARRLADRVLEDATRVFDVLERRECDKTLRSAYLSVFNTVYGILLDHLVMGTDIAFKVREYEETLDRKIEALRERYPELPPKIAREVERLEKMKITKMLDKPAEAITLGDLLSLLKTLAGKLVALCIEEWRRKEREKEEREEEEEAEEAEETEEEG